MTNSTADKASAAGRALVAQRYAKQSPEERSRAASIAASTPWEGLTLDERRKEVKRRMAGKAGKASRVKTRRKIVKKRRRRRQQGRAKP